MQLALIVRGLLRGLLLHALEHLINAFLTIDGTRLCNGITGSSRASRGNETARGHLLGRVVIVSIGRLVEEQDLVQKLDVHVYLLDQLLQLIVQKRVELFPELGPETFLLEWAQFGQATATEMRQMVLVLLML